MPNAPTPQIDQPAVLEFPLHGIDSSNEFELQPAGTTIGGQNVRSFEALTLRGRGGSRPGLTRHFDDQLPGPLQDLGIISIASPDAVLTDDGLQGQTLDGLPGSDGGGWGDGAGGTGGPGPGGDTGAGEDPNGFADPSNDSQFDRGRRRFPRNPTPHHRWRPGGSGRQRPKKKRSRPQTPGAVDDTVYAVVGGAPVTIDVLANDNFIGVPSVRLNTVPDLGGGHISKTGKSRDTRVIFTPASTGDGGTYVVGYQLAASGNKGKSFANIILIVTKDPVPTCHTLLRNFVVHGSSEIIVVPTSHSVNYCSCDSGVTVTDPTWGTRTFSPPDSLTASALTALINTTLYPGFFYTEDPPTITGAC